jgi:pimeloyl-ACP methyl ester carboxylesterase
MVDGVDAVEVGGFRIAFEREGHGPPLLLLHGFVGDGVGTWRYQLETLSDEFTVVAWDAPGAGRSSAAPESFRLSDYADCLFGFVSALKLTHPYVAGLSFGSVLALELFRRHRGLPRKLVLASAYAGWAGSFPPDVVQERLQLSLELSRLPAADFVAALLPSMFSPEAAADRVAAFAENAAEFDPVGFRAMAIASAEADMRDVLPYIDVPTLLLYGDRDVRAPRQVAEALLAGIPESRLVMIPGVGHINSVEAPDQFSAEVRTFLNEREWLAS